MRVVMQLVIAVVLLSVLPRHANAQSVRPAVVDSTPTSESTETPAVDAQPETNGSVAWEAAGGVVGWLVGLLPAVPFFVCWLENDRHAASECKSAAPFAWLSAPLVPFTITFGIWTAGELSGGDGGWGWTLLGQALGGLATIPIGALALFCNGLDGYTDDCAGAYALVAAAIVAVPVIGGVVAYNRSDVEVEVEPLEQLSAALAPTPDMSGAQLLASGLW